MIDDDISIAYLSRPPYPLSLCTTHITTISAFTPTTSLFILQDHVTLNKDSSYPKAQG